VPLATATATSVNLLLPPGRTYRYTVQATDRAGNLSTVRAAAASRPRAVSEGSTSVTWSGRWAPLVHSAWLHGRARTSSTAAAAARFTFSGREVALVAGVGPTRGLARIYVDGTFVTSVDLRRATASGRIVVFRYRFTVVGTHRIEVRVVGTAGRPRVDVDGFVVVDPGT
jgi:hypothetical protein